MKLFEKIFGEYISKGLSGLSAFIKKHSTLTVFAALFLLYYVCKDDVVSFTNVIRTLPKQLSELQKGQNHLSNQNSLITIQIDTVKKTLDLHENKLNQLIRNDSVLNTKIKLIYKVTPIEDNIRNILDDYINRKLSQKSIEIYPCNSDSFYYANKTDTNSYYENIVIDTNKTKDVFNDVFCSQKKTRINHNLKDVQMVTIKTLSGGNKITSREIYIPILLDLKLVSTHFKTN